MHLLTQHFHSFTVRCLNVCFEYRNRNNNNNDDDVQLFGVSECINERENTPAHINTKKWWMNEWKRKRVLSCVCMYAWIMIDRVIPKLKPFEFEQIPKENIYRIIFYYILFAIIIAPIGWSYTLFGYFFKKYCRNTTLAGWYCKHVVSDVLVSECTHQSFPWFECKYKRKDYYLIPLHV